MTPEQFHEWGERQPLEVRRRAMTGIRERRPQSRAVMPAERYGRDDTDRAAAELELMAMRLRLLELGG